jgi:hypothetical protein
MRLGGPKLKMSDLSAARSKLPGRSGPDTGSSLKAPDFLTDLYYDLRDRRLLLPLALVLVAIAAVPFLLGSKPEPVPVPPAGGIAAAVGAAGDAGSKLTVVEAQPGLREYSKRLKHRSPSDPFKQHYTGLPPAAQVEATQGGGGGSEGSGEAVTVTESTTTEVTGTGSSGSGSASGGGSSHGGGAVKAPPKPDAGSLRIIEYVYDMQISHAETTADGTQKMSEPEVRRHVKTLAQLPGKKLTVATVGGINFHTGKVYFLVADGVHSLGGDFRCVTRAPGELCELLEIEAGFPLELTYGPNKVLYRIKVTGINAVWAGKPGDQRSKSGGKGARRPSAATQPRSSFGAQCGSRLDGRPGLACAQRFSK